MLFKITPKMKEKERSDYENKQYSHTHTVKKKCKKKRSPVDDIGDKHRHHRSANPDGRKNLRTEHRSREYEDEESRRKERDYNNGESRRKDRDVDESEIRRKPCKKDRDLDDVDGKRRDREVMTDVGTRKRCTKRKEQRRSAERRRDPRDQKARVKEEPLSDSDLELSSHRDRSRSPCQDRHGRDEKKTSNMDALINVKEEKHEWGRGEEKEKKKPIENKAKPDFGLSGKLAEETNVVNGVVIKYSEPEEARKPKVRWRLYPFKGENSLPVLHLHRQSAYLVGRDRKIADLPVDHPSCSKQHAVLQYRLVPYTRPNGTQSKRVRPYIIDLESANGTFVNNKKIESKKYVELLERDVIKFAFSSREYVLLHEHSKDANLDDDVQ